MKYISNTTVFKYSATVQQAYLHMRDQMPLITKIIAALHDALKNRPIPFTLGLCIDEALSL